MFAVIFICENLFLQIAGKIAKIRTGKKFHAIQYMLKNIILFLENSDLCVWTYSVCHTNVVRRQHSICYNKNIYYIYRGSLCYDFFFHKKIMLKSRTEREGIRLYEKRNLFLALSTNEHVLSGWLAMSPQCELLYPTDRLTVINLM